MRVVLTTGDEVLFRSADDPNRFGGRTRRGPGSTRPPCVTPTPGRSPSADSGSTASSARPGAPPRPKGMNWLYEVFVVQATEQTGVHRRSTWANPFLGAAFVHALESSTTGDWAKQERGRVHRRHRRLADRVAPPRGRTKRTAAYNPKGGPIVAGVDVAGRGKMRVSSASGRASDPATSRRSRTPMPEDPCWRPSGSTAILGFERGDRLGGAGPLLRSPRRRPRLQVRDVNVGEQADQRLSPRAVRQPEGRVYWALRERFVAGSVAGLTDRTAMAQLRPSGTAHDARGRIKIEKKEDLA